MHLTFNQKAELDSLVNFFGGKSLLVPAWQRDPTHHALKRNGLTRWGKRRGGLVEHIATAKGIAIARRFKVRWADLWAARNPSDPE